MVLKSSGFLIPKKEMASKSPGLLMPEVEYSWSASKEFQLQKVRIRWWDTDKSSKNDKKTNK